MFDTFLLNNWRSYKINFALVRNKVDKKIVKFIMYLLLKVASQVTKQIFITSKKNVIPLTSTWYFIPLELKFDKFLFLWS